MVIKRLMGFALTLLVSVALVTPVSAQLEFRITTGDVQTTKIAIVPFGWTGAGPVPFDIAQVVENDLKGTGRFEAFARSNMLDKPTTAAQVDYADWGLLGVEVLVVGSQQALPGGSYKINFQAFDIVRKKQILAYDLNAPLTKMRAVAHYIADQVYEQVEGTRGVFSTRIAYITVSDDRQFELIVADADGENRKTIIRSSEPIMSPAWSPDGRELAYVIYEQDGWAIYTRNIFTGKRQRISARPGVNGAPSFSPDGRRMAMTLSDRNGNLDIYVMTLATGDLKRITRHSAIDTEPEWSKDGKTLYFNSDRSNGPQIYEVPANGGREVRLTFEGSYNARPRISPDGKSLAMVHNDKGNFRIGIMDLTSGGLRIVSAGRLDESPSYAPNGSVLIYASTESRRGALETVSEDGQVRQQLSSQGNEVREPVWSPFADGL